MKAYYEVTAAIGSKQGRATFCQTDDDSFDLLYGWAEFTSGMHPTLARAIDDFRQRLRQKHPTEQIAISKPREISEEQAKRNSPSYGV